MSLIWDNEEDFALWGRDGKKTFWDKESENVSHSVMSDSVTPMDCSLPSSSVHGLL